jgi:hypothetical protein
MSEVTWVSGTAIFSAIATTVATTLPTGLSDDGKDGVFAFVMHRGTLTPPAGWTVKATVTFNHPTDTQYVSFAQKDTVAAADSGTAATWTQDEASVLYATYAHCRGVVGRARYAASNTGSTNSTSSTTITSPSITCVRAQEMLLLSGSTMLASGSSYTATAPTGSTLWTGGMAAMRLAAAYYKRLAGEGTSGTWTLIASGSNNGLGAMSVRIVDSGIYEEYNDTVGTAGAFDLSASTYGTTVAETLAFRYYALYGTLHEADASDVLSLLEALDLIQPAFVDTLTDQANFSGTPASTYRPGREVSETLNLAPTMVVNRGVLITELLRIAPVFGPSLVSGGLAEDVLSLIDALRAGENVSLAETVGLALALQSVLATRVSEGLGIATVLDKVAKFGLTLTQEIALADALRRFFAGDVTETVGMALTQSAIKSVTPTLSETLGLEPAVASTFVLRLTASDTVGLDDVDVLKLVFAPTLSDEIEVSALYVAPGGGFVTWTMNARSGAVTEYSNFDFNSFADMGNGRYVGARSDGLYELTGDDDDGDDIVARIKSGFAQFAGSRFTGFKAVYLGMRGEGDFVLKIEAGTGEVYTYAVIAESMKTTKVNVGKGLRARYFSFELISTGQDFDLDNVEFVPMVANRRV